MVPIVTVDRLFSDASPLIPRSENISTFRIFCPTFNRERVTIRRSTTATIAGGFSAAGGLWTFINGFFAVIFGQSLLHILFGSSSSSYVIQTYHKHITSQDSNRCRSLVSYIVASLNVRSYGKP